MRDALILAAVMMAPIVYLTARFDHVESRYYIPARAAAWKAWAQKDWVATENEQRRMDAAIACLHDDTCWTPAK